MLDRHDLNKIEAVLFTTGRFMTADEISHACSIASVGYVKEILDALKQDYEQRDSSLSIVVEDSRYKMNIKKDYGHLANKLVSSSEFDNPTTKTLAVIAYKNPAIQSDVIKIRGNKAYDHIHLLKESGLITAEKSGRTRLLKVTPKFYDYFDVAEEKVKEEFTKITQLLSSQTAAQQVPVSSNDESSVSLQPSDPSGDPHNKV